MATKKQIQTRLTRSATKPSRVFPRHKQPWTTREDKLLVKLFRGITIRRGVEESACYRIADQLGRTPMAVRKRIEILRVAPHWSNRP